MIGPWVVAGRCGGGITCPDFGRDGWPGRARVTAADDDPVATTCPTAIVHVRPAHASPTMGLTSRLRRYRCMFTPPRSSITTGPPPVTGRAFGDAWSCPHHFSV